MATREDRERALIKEAVRLAGPRSLLAGTYGGVSFVDYVTQNVDRTHPIGTPPVDAGVRADPRDIEHHIAEEREARDEADALVARLVAVKDPGTWLRRVVAAGVLLADVMPDGIGELAIADEVLSRFGPPPSSETSEEYDERLRAEGRAEAGREKAEHIERVGGHSPLAAERVAGLASACGVCARECEAIGEPYSCTHVQATAPDSVRVTTTLASGAVAARWAELAAAAAPTHGLTVPKSARLKPEADASSETSERAAVIEECARVCDARAAWYGHQADAEPSIAMTGAMGGCERAAREIRALASPLPRVEAEPPRPRLALPVIGACCDCAHRDIEEGGWACGLTADPNEPGDMGAFLGDGDIRPPPDWCPLRTPTAPSTQAEQDQTDGEEAMCPNARTQEEATKIAREWLSDDDVSVAWSDEGHSGPGWYAHVGDYPDEGSLHIGKAATPEQPIGVVGWQPIETAPKDGTKVVLCNTHTVGLGWWFHNAAAWSWESIWPATHWMPLPAPPGSAREHASTPDLVRVVAERVRDACAEVAGAYAKQCSEMGDVYVRLSDTKAAGSEQAADCLRTATREYAMRDGAWVAEERAKNVDVHAIITAAREGGATDTQHGTVMR